MQKIICGYCSTNIHIEQFKDIMPNFFDAKVVARYKEIAEQIGVKTDERYLIGEQNLEFRIYKILTCEHLNGRTLEEDKQMRKEAIERCKKLVDVVVTVLPEWKLEYILEFLKFNKKPEDFKKIHLFNSICSWSGSEITLIIKKMEFLKLLKDNLKGIDYIEHKKYIEDYCMKLEKYKDSVELDEYLENADYA